MKKLLTLSLISLSYLVSFSQSYELCIDGDTIRIDNSNEPFELYHILPPSSRCHDYLTEATCAANSAFCVWELEEECVPRSQTSTDSRPINPINVADSCSISTTQAECETRAFFGCAWGIASSSFDCSTSSDSVYDLVPIIDETKAKLAETNYSYIFRYSPTEALSFQGLDLNPCGTVTGTQEQYFLNSSIYPNPATKDELNIVFDKPYSMIDISVYNQNGILIDSINNASGESVQINTSEWSNGSYTIIVNANGTTSSQTIVK